MSGELLALLADARHVGAAERGRLGVEIATAQPAGCLLLQTCHRVEVYGPAADVERLAASAGVPAAARVLRGPRAARHLISVAVGRESTVVAEDQLLHQLRRAAHEARARAPLPAELDRLIDLALRAGRQARSWLPSRRPSLAEVALERVMGGQAGDLRARAQTSVLLIGAGEMGRRAARALADRGVVLLVASRTPERAAALVALHGGRSVAFDPGPAVVGGVDGVLIALAGPWRPSEATRARLLESSAWLVDLSAPPALEGELAAALAERLLTIDELAQVADATRPSGQLLERLEALIEETLAKYQAWSMTDEQRSAARALSRRAQEAQASELEALWRRMPRLEAEQRAEVEQMARQLTERLLRDPLERLHEDRDGRRARAARELFRL